MNENLIKDITMDDKNKYKHWSKSVEEDGITKKVMVGEIENGFIICLEECGEKNGEYKFSEKKYFSKTNPLKDMQPDMINNDEVIQSAIKDFLDN